MIAIQNAHAVGPSCSNQLMVANQNAHALGPRSTACEAPVAFALAPSMVLAEFDEEMRKQGVGWTTETGILGGCR